MDALANLGINPGFLVVFALYFFLVMFVLTRWAYTPVINGLENRKRRIAQGLEDARVAAEARANAEAEARKVIAEAQAEANRRVAEAVQRAERSAAEVKAAAEAERARIIKSAEDDIAAQRTQMLADLRPQVSALAMAAANKIIGASMDEQRQRALIDEFFSGVKGGKVAFEAGSMGGQAVEVTSALPLTDAEKSSLQRDLGAAGVHYRVDPGILGGLIVRAGDKVVDGSVAGKLEGLRQAVK
jgi:F-type H+-transporting ATPase subunit b